jgi:hypothetical protein
MVGAKDAGLLKGLALPASRTELHFQANLDVLRLSHHLSSHLKSGPV